MLSESFISLSLVEMLLFMFSAVSLVRFSLIGLEGELFLSASKSDETGENCLVIYILVQIMEKFLGYFHSLSSLVAFSEAVLDAFVFYTWNQQEFHPAFFYVLLSLWCHHLGSWERLVPDSICEVIVSHQNSVFQFCLLALLKVFRQIRTFHLSKSNWSNGKF